MPKIAILTGGESSEREIALLSSQFITTQAKRFFSVDVFDFPQDLPRFIKDQAQYVLAIPVFHGRGGEDGQIQGFLETLKTPYLFSGIDGHSAGMNKVFSKLIAQSIKINQPGFQIILPGEQIRFSQKSVVKPYDNGSSVGVYIVGSQIELNHALETVFKLSDKALVEEFVAGEEYTVAVVDLKKKPQALPVIWIKPKKNSFFDYKSKYSDNGADEVCPAPIDKKLSDQLQQIAVKIHQTLGLKHLSRSDFIVKDQRPYFLEVNTIPGLTKNSLVPKAVKTADLDFGLLLKDWVETELKKRVRW